MRASIRARVTILNFQFSLDVMVVIFNMLVILICETYVDKTFS